MPAEGRHGLGTIGLGKCVDKGFLTLEGGDDRNTEGSAEGGGEGGEHGVAKVDDIWADFISQEADEAMDLSGVGTFNAGEDADGHAAESGGGGLDGEPGYTAEQRGAVELLPQGSGEVAKEGKGLLEEEGDAAHEDGGGWAEEGRIGAEGRVEGDGEELVSGGVERTKEFGIAMAGTAIERTCAGSDVGDSQKVLSRGERKG